MNPSQQYSHTADELTLRFKVIIDSNPELKNETDLFKFFAYGLNVKDLQPSLFQAQWALQKAKQIK